MNARLRDWIPGGYRLERKFRVALGRRFLVDLGDDHRKNIYIAGTGRSGTTWLSELVNHRNTYRQIFEPFHPNSPVGPVFPRHLYLRADDPDGLRLRAAQRVLHGQIRGLHVDRFNKRLISSRRVIKDISSNLFLKWLHVHFPGMPFILIIRHPCAVLQSQLNVGWEDWRDKFEGMLEQQPLVQDHLEPFIPELKRLQHGFEQNVAIWCIQNYVPLVQFGRDEIHVVFYENLCMQPEQELRKLMAFLGLRFDPHILRSVRQASFMALAGSAVQRGTALVDGWKDHLPGAHVRRAMEIVAMFGLDKIYSEDPMPSPDAIAPFVSGAVTALPVSVPTL
jgi:hypothetical protein